MRPAAIGRAVRVACASLVIALAPDAAGAPDDSEMSAAVDRRAVPEAIAVCHGHGCGLTDLVSLRGETWDRIRALFTPVPATALQERAAVAHAVGLFEQAAGRQLGTEADRPRTVFNMNDPTQLDCVDESINTSSLLHLLSQHDLLHWHRVGEPVRRYRFLIFGVHFTAVLQESASGTAFAVDSWFRENGADADIVELARWRAGWEPEP